MALALALALTSPSLPSLRSLPLRRSPPLVSLSLSSRSSLLSLQFVARASTPEFDRRIDFEPDDPLIDTTGDQGGYGSDGGSGGQGSGNGGGGGDGERFEEEEEGEEEDADVSEIHSRLCCSRRSWRTYGICEERKHEISSSWRFIFPSIVLCLHSAPNQPHFCFVPWSRYIRGSSDSNGIPI